MQKRGPACGRPSPGSSTRSLRSQLADPRRPVGERRSATGPVARAATRTEQVVAGPAHEERATPSGVVARVTDVLAGDPDGVAVHRSSAVVTPARPDRIGEPLLFVAGEPVVGSGAFTTRNETPVTDACLRVDRRIRGARIQRLDRCGEG